MSTILGPRTDRFESLDVLRGIAILGILMVNLPAMALVPEGYYNPFNHMIGAPERELAAHHFVSTFFTFKFITIFTALFGAGMLLMISDGSAERVGKHRIRMAWLLLFGMIHCYLIWYGDILVTYALAGFIVILMRNWGPITLMIWGFVFAALNGALYLGFMSTMSFMPPEDYKTTLETFWNLSPELVAESVAIAQAPFLERAGAMAVDASYYQMGSVIGYMLRAVGVMMMGMALYKWGFFTLRWKPWAYALATVLALPVGLYTSWWSAEQAESVDFDLLASLPSQWALWFGSLVHAFGYAALAMLICTIPGIKLLRAPFAAVGKMAFTNYIGCSLAGFFIFLGPPGLGRFGEVTRMDLIVITLVMWGVMLVVSPLWLSVFRMGPLEWLWRSLTYLRPQPLLRGRGEAA